MTPHIFKPSKKHGQCAECGGWPDANYHNQELFTGTDWDRETIRQLELAAEMTAKLREPLKDVSRAAGIMERESPLFKGKGENPCLF